MKFLIDANIAPRLADILTETGHDAVAVRDVDLSRASDTEIFDCASSHNRILITHDTDFSGLLQAERRADPH